MGKAFVRQFSTFFYKVAFIDHLIFEISLRQVSPIEFIFSIRSSKIVFATTSTNFSCFENELIEKKQFMASQLRVKVDLEVISPTFYKQLLHAQIPK